MYMGAPKFCTNIQQFAILSINLKYTSEQSGRSSHYQLYTGGLDENQTAKKSLKYVNKFVWAFQEQFNHL